MSYFINVSSLNLSEADINTTTGTITTKGPLPVTGLQTGTVVIGVAYDSTIPGWRLLIVSPT